MRIAFLKIVVDLQTLARLILCSVFMFAGANFSHGNELYHQTEGISASHHSAIDQYKTEISIVPHSHFEPEPLNQELDEIAVHCGSPELQPGSVVFSNHMVVIGALGNRFRMVFAGTSFDLEPPPPRS